MSCRAALLSPSTGIVDCHRCVLDTCLLCMWLGIAGRSLSPALPACLNFPTPCPALHCPLSGPLPSCSLMAELHRQFEEAGGSTAFYSRVEHGSVGGAVQRLSMRDVHSGEGVELSTAAVVNAAGLHAQVGGMWALHGALCCSQVLPGKLAWLVGRQAFGSSHQASVTNPHCSCPSPHPAGSGHQPGRPPRSRHPTPAPGEGKLLQPCGRQPARWRPPRLRSPHLPAA